MLGPRAILLVEDVEADAMLIKEAFRKARIVNPIFQVGTGSEALSYLAGDGQFSDRTKHPFPDFVLLDMKLPDVDGLEVLRALKANARLSGLPVVVVTGSENPNAREDAQKCGASAFFRKALKFEDLIEMVRQIGGEWQLMTPPKPMKELKP